MITNGQLRATFLAPAMWRYFQRKLADVPAEELRVRIEECLKFLNIATHCKGNIPVTQEIDDIWHNWILETAQYERLCQGLTGRRFIHHQSNDYQEPGAGATENILEWEVAALSTYVTNYGPFKPDRVKYWRLADHLVTQRQWTVEELNSWLMASADEMAAQRVNSGGQGSPLDPPRLAAQETPRKRAKLTARLAV